MAVGAFFRTYPVFLAQLTPLNILTSTCKNEGMSTEALSVDVGYNCFRFRLVVLRW